MGKSRASPKKAKKASPKKKATATKKSTPKRRTPKKSPKKKAAKKTTLKKTVGKRKKRVSMRGTRAQVFRGTKAKVKTTGHTKKDLMRNKRGKIVSKVSHRAGLRTYKRNGLANWNKALLNARNTLGHKGFVAVKKGTPLYDETMKIYLLSKA